MEFISRGSKIGQQHQREKFPRRVMEVEAGYPRLALGMAFHFHNYSGYSEPVSKSLAKSMVEVWIKYDVPFRKLRRISTSRPEELSGELLRDLLEKKVKGDLTQKKARSSQLQSLIEMTVKVLNIVHN